VSSSASHGVSVAQFVRQNLLLVGIMLFTVISSVPDLLRVINEAMCWPAWTLCSSVSDVSKYITLFTNNCSSYNTHI